MPALARIGTSDQVRRVHPFRRPAPTRAPQAGADLQVGCTIAGPASHKPANPGTIPHARRFPATDGPGCPILDCLKALVCGRGPGCTVWTESAIQYLLPALDPRSSTGATAPPTLPTTTERQSLVTIVHSHQTSARAVSDRDRARTIRPPADPSAQGSARPSVSHPSGAYPASSTRPSGIRPSNGTNGSAAKYQVQDDEERTLVRMAGQGRSGEPPPLHSELPRPARSQEWYVRLKLRQDYVAKLWVRNLTPRDVLVWWSKRQCWAPLLTVPELRQAIVSVADTPPRSEGNRASLPDIPRTQPKPREMVPPSARPLPASGTDVLFRPTGTVARRLSSSIPPAILGRQGSETEIPRPPRTPSFGPATQPHPAYVPSARAEPLRSSYPPPARVPATTSMLPPAMMADRAGLSNAERAVWMFAGVAVMIAAVAALRAGTRQESLATAPVMVAAPAGAPVAPAPPPAVAGSAQPVARAAAVPNVSQAAAPPQPDEAQAHAAQPSANHDRASSGATRGSGKTGAARSGHKVASSTHQPGAAQQDTAGSAPKGDAKVVRAVAAPDGFDTAAARRALASAAARASQCAGSGAKGSVVVTFAPTGLVQSASLAQISGDNVRQACVLRAFRLAQIAPYVGAPVTVRKSFRVP